MTGHIQTDDERRRDAEQVRLLNSVLYGTGHAFSPDDAKQSRIDHEDEEAIWAVRLASPEVAQEDN